MEAIYFGNDSGWWREKPADDNKLGPWVMADIENGRPCLLYTSPSPRDRG